MNTGPAVRESHKVLYEAIEALLDLRILDSLRNLNHRIDKLQMTQDELVQQLKDDSAKIIKIGTETRALLTKVQELLDQIAAGEVKPEVADAAADVAAQLGIVDDLVPDAPAPEA